MERSPLERSRGVPELRLPRKFPRGLFGISGEILRKFSGKEPSGLVAKEGDL
jgi:hypothetical protein